MNGEPRRVRRGLMWRLRQIGRSLLILSGIALLVGLTLRGEWLTLAVYMAGGAFLMRLWS
jgi:uncharacterized membrane protein (UPF0182 family)